MKILEVISQMMFRGGGEVFFSFLVCELEKSQDVYCLVLHDGFDPSFEYLKEKFAGRFFTCNKKNGFDLKAAKRFKEIVDQIKPDLVHSHCQCVVTYFLAFKTRKTAFRYYHTLHSTAKTEAPFYDRVLKKILVRKSRLSLIAISPAVAKTAKDIYKKDVPVIENGIDMTPYANVKAKQIWSGNFICVAGFRPVKNHELLFKGFAELKKEGRAFHLTCCGGGETLEASKKLVRELGIENEVIFTGWIKDVSPLLMQSDCFVLTSHYEGSPISIIEGLASALPCIAPKVGGIPDLIDEENGILFEPEQLASLHDALNIFYDNPNSYPIHSQNALKSAKRHNMEECAKTYARLFESDCLKQE